MAATRDGDDVRQAWGTYQAHIAEESLQKGARVHESACRVDKNPEQTISAGANARENSLGRALSRGLHAVPISWRLLAGRENPAIGRHDSNRIAGRAPALSPRRKILFMPALSASMTQLPNL